MTKRIVSGVFLLIALGALGLILAGALTSGEQLIVRFLTAVIVAALGLYVISDLRLQADDDAMATPGSRTGPASATRVAANELPPPNSTAAFMATVTGKKSSSSTVDSSSPWDPPTPAADRGSETPGEAANAPEEEQATAAAPAENQIDPAGWTRPQTDGERVDAERVDADRSPVVDDDHEERRIPAVISAVADGENPYAPDADEVAQWPLTPEGKAVEELESIPDAGDNEVDGLMAVFARRREQEELRDRSAMAAAGGAGPSLFDTTFGAETGTGGTVGTALPSLAPIASIDAATYSHAPLAPIIDLRLRATDDESDDIEAAIRSGELEVISSLIEQGVLSTEGPISDRDVRTMVYVAFTSNELRKLLLAGGTIDGDNSGIDLGPVELFRSALGRTVGRAPALGTTTGTEPVPGTGVVDIRSGGEARSDADAPSGDVDAARPTSESHDELTTTAERRDELATSDS